MSKAQKIVFSLVCLAVVILLFTIIDHFIHGLEAVWSVPDYYFKDKIPFGFLWGAVGLIVALKVRNIWLKSLIVAAIIAATLQVRYFLEGYPLSFVLIFLLFHFVILYVLLACMFKVYYKNT